jgi:putative DNA primase/helicase
MTETIEDAFRRAIEVAGIRPPEEIIPDGRFHRYATNRRLDDKAGWYILFSDGIPAGEFGDWRTDIKHTWCAKKETALTAEEQAQYRARIAVATAQRQAEEQRRHAEAAAEAEQIWNAARPAETHPYLLKKKVAPYGVRMHEGRLVVPMRDKDGRLHSLQFINADGTKKFLLGGRTKACFHLIGTLPHQLLCLAEGYATAASLHEATGYPVAVCFSAGNLTAVARAFHDQTES